MKKNIDVLIKDLDTKNLTKIREAFESGRIDAGTRDYLNHMYSDSMAGFKQQFYFLGRMLGAPKTQVYRYDSKNDKIDDDKEIQISEIGPSETYLVYHRFDNDPMRNQFFTFDGGTDVQFLVSSIISVIIASQKSVSRAIEKITGRYYDEYLDSVLAAVEKVLAKHGKSASISAIQAKISARFNIQFISSAAPEVLKIIGNIFPEISVDLVREIDKIVPPYARLMDVYRMKLLFDIVPQINSFIDLVRQTYGDSVRMVKNKFYDLDNDRSYRDAKIIIDADISGKIIPIEIICNVRTFFDSERQSHSEYEKTRKGKELANLNNEMKELHQQGITQYNAMICQSVQYLLQRVGWNIMYEKDLGIDSFFSGFPKIGKLPYSNNIVETILNKIDSSVKNEIFILPQTPRDLSEQEEISVFRYMTRFILFAALPYSLKYEEITDMGFAGKLFNFVMKELYRYYENDVL